MGTEVLWFNTRMIVLGLLTGPLLAVAPTGSAPSDVLAPLFEALGPAAVFLLLSIAGAGVHLPEDLIIIPAGWEVGSGNFSIGWTALAAFAGVVLGDTGWFFLWRRLGTRLIRSPRFLKRLHPRRVLEVKHLFDQYGAWVLVVSRCVPGARTVAVAVAGLTHVSWRVFLLVELPMAAATVLVQLSLGYWAQRGIVGAGKSVHWVTLGLGCAVLITLVVGGIVAWRRWRGKRLPRAKIAWLRSL